MLKNSLQKIFDKSPAYLFDQKFTTLPLVKQLFDQYIAKDQKLIIDNMDEDQVWAQIDEQIQGMFKYIKTNTDKIEDKALTLADEEAKRIEEEENKNEEQEEEEVEEEEQPDEDEFIFQKDEIEQENYNEIEEKIVKSKKIIKKTRQSKRDQIREDEEEFEQFEKYLEEIDQGKRVIDEDNYNDEEIGEDIEEENEEDEDGEDEEGYDEQEEGQDDYDNNQEYDEDLEDNKNQDDGEEEEGENSVFDEMREMQMNTVGGENEEQILSLEKKMLQKKEWQMSGEVSNKQRPVNSLLDENVDFNVSTTKIAQQTVSTKEYAQSLEEKIRKRILDELWDDRQKLQFSQFLQDNFGSKKQSLELNKNKSQLGLGEIYEEQFKSSLGLPSNTSEQKAKQEIFNLFRDLCFKLDSLSNLSFEPRGFAKAAEIKVNNKETMAINREENLPFTLAGSQKTDVIKFKSKNNFQSKEEGTALDHKRSHRQVKQKIRKQKQANKSKGLIKKLETKGETKAMHLAAVKGQAQLSKLNSQIKQVKSVTFDKSSNFFKNLQNSRDQQPISMDVKLGSKKYSKK